jgi:hypothetical protein
LKFFSVDIPALSASVLSGLNRKTTLENFDRSPLARKIKSASSLHVD